MVIMSQVDIRAKRKELIDSILKDESMIYAVVEQYVFEIPYRELERHLQEMRMSIKLER